MSSSGLRMLNKMGWLTNENFLSAGNYLKGTSFSDYLQLSPAVIEAMVVSQ